MKISPHPLTLKVESSLLSPTSRCYRLPSFPPPEDWPTTENADGTPLSLWADSYWDFSQLHRKPFKMYFNREAQGGRKTEHLGENNTWDLKLIATAMIWGPHGSTSTNLLKNDFRLIRRLVCLCEKNGIRIRNLSRYPAVVSAIPTVITNTNMRERLIVLLDRLLPSQGLLDFTILDGKGIARLAEIFANNSSTATGKFEQTAYIPPRIYLHIANRQRECIEDFLAHKDAITKCFEFCLNSYINNYGSLEAAFKSPDDWLRPFSKPIPSALYLAISSGRYQGPFLDTARKFGIDKLLEKWIMISTGEDGFTVRDFSSYLTLVTSVCFAYLGSFTFQRKEELAALRSDCLVWEQDTVVGSIPIICGETTKTDPDSDARWPTSPHVVVAIDAAVAISRMRLTCVYDSDSEDAQRYLKNPFLFCSPMEPWTSSRTGGTVSEVRGYSVRPYICLGFDYPKLFDPDVLRITEDDLSHAKMFTPNLHKRGGFSVGKIWPLSYHQLRRTGGINMYASGLLTESSIQLILKHLTVFQTRYYGQNFSSSRINQIRQTLVINSAYEVLAKQILVSVEARYVSPAGNVPQQDGEVHLLSQNEFKKLKAAARRGEVGFRETILGGCIKRSECQYNGIESVARCAGGDDKTPCFHAKLDKSKRVEIINLLATLEAQLKDAIPNSPRHKALQMEVNGLRNYCEFTAN